MTFEMNGDYVLLDVPTRSVAHFFDSEAEALGYYAGLLRFFGRKFAGRLVLQRRQGYKYVPTLNQFQTLEKAMKYV